MALFDSIRSPCRWVSTLWQFAASRWYWWSASPCRLTAGVWTRCALDKLVGHNPEQAQSVAEMQTAKVTWTARRGIRKCIHELYKNNKSTLIHIYCDSSDVIPHNPTQTQPTPTQPNPTHPLPLPLDEARTQLQKHQRNGKARDVTDEHHLQAGYEIGGQPITINHQLIERAVDQ